MYLYSWIVLDLGVDAIAIAEGSLWCSACIKLDVCLSMSLSHHIMQCSSRWRSPYQCNINLLFSYLTTSYHMELCLQCDTVMYCGGERGQKPNIVSPHLSIVRDRVLCIRGHIWRSIILQLGAEQWLRYDGGAQTRLQLRILNCLAGGSGSFGGICDDYEIHRRSIYIPTSVYH